MKNLLKEINQFYPDYLKAHNDMTNQVLHFIGATLFFTLLGFGLYKLNIWIVLSAVFIGYLLPGIGHRFFQHNDSFRATKPILCVACAGKLYFDTLTFQIKRKMKEV
jgi:hypothetical protein